MTEGNSQITLNEAANQFLSGISSAEAAGSTPEIQRFVRWFGRDKTVSSLTPLEIANYAGRFSVSDTDHLHKLEIIHKFLTYAKKAGWTASNLSVHLKAKKNKVQPPSGARQTHSDMGVLTQKGYEDIQNELAKLRAQRPQVLEDIRRAAADKDFRENAPLHAAREQLGHIDGRIKELEVIMKSATIIDQSAQSRTRVAVGDTVVLVALDSGKEQRYTIVGPKESDPSRGKISHISPIGIAIIGKNQGDTVEIVVPAGRIRYRIEKVEN